MFRKVASRPEHSAEVKQKQNYRYVSQKSQLKSIDYVKNISLLLERSGSEKKPLMIFGFFPLHSAGAKGHFIQQTMAAKSLVATVLPQTAYEFRVMISLKFEVQQALVDSIMTRMTRTQRRELAEPLCIGPYHPSKQ